MFFRESRIPKLREISSLLALALFYDRFMYVNGSPNLYVLVFIRLVSLHFSHWIYISGLCLLSLFEENNLSKQRDVI